MIMKLGMEHYELKLYTVCVNDVPEFTLTYFTTISNLAKIIFCTYSRPRYQVSIYKTTGPLVHIFAQNIDCGYRLEPPQ